MAQGRPRRGLSAPPAFESLGPKALFFFFVCLLPRSSPVTRNLVAGGGEGGGKADAANGQVPDSSKMEEALMAAEEYASGKL
mmetsp:Transcript_33938/g.79233  ORF Transcript_33938/g.79233 Transcript_33938/m.79233 type:complete len:82 (-) Transcript_33938:397-642(-)